MTSQKSPSITNALVLVALITAIFAVGLSTGGKKFTGFASGTSEVSIPSEADNSPTVDNNKIDWSYDGNGLRANLYSKPKLINAKGAYYSGEEEPMPTPSLDSKEISRWDQIASCQGDLECISSKNNEFQKEDRLELANTISSIFNIEAAKPVQYYLEQIIGADVGWEGWREWGDFFGWTMSGYETALCDAQRSEYFIQDYAGHYATDGGYPTVGAMIYAVGRRSEYPNYNWVTSCTFDGESPKWFPKVNASGNQSAEALGYLYKISWYIGYPFNTWDVETWSEVERQSYGLEKDGSIKYKVRLYGEACSSEDLPSYYEFPAEPIEMGGSASATHAYYDKAYMKRICIIFDRFEYDGSKKEWCSDLTTDELEAPQDFTYFPEETTGASSTSTGTSTGVSTGITTGTEEDSTEECTTPGALCSTYGFEE